MNKIDFVEIAKTIKKPWSPIVIKQVEDHVIREAIFEGHEGYGGIT